MDSDQAFKEASAAYDAHDFPTAVTALFPLASDGHAAAQCLLAEMYRWGKGVDQNAEKSLHFYKAAADQGHPRAALDLSFLLEPTGRSAPEVMQSLPKDADASKYYLNVAVIRFKELAEAGDMEAMSYLGFLYHHGYGVELNGVEAIRWYTKAFDAGGHGVANNLALVHYEGDLRVRDKAKALFWYKKMKEFNCQCIAINEFETILSSSEVSTPKGWTVMGYEISIRRDGGMISLSEWHAAVAATEAVRLRSGDVSITNPKTGEVISIPNSGGDAEFFAAEHERWIPVFRWRSGSGDIAFPLTPEFSNPSGVLRATARQLALRLGAAVIGDGGEIYD